MIPRLLERLKAQVAEAVELREGNTWNNAFAGVPPEEIVVCLGPGRCMLPFPDNGQTRRCALCKTYPQGVGTHKQVAGFVHILAGGN